VFGRTVGAAIPVGSRDEEAPREGTEAAGAAGAAVRSITQAELLEHSTAASCWVAIDGRVFDFTAFLEEHPAGAQSILGELPGGV
jgi:cytochrome b involved in lipid metabolism